MLTAMMKLISSMSFSFKFSFHWFIITTVPFLSHYAFVYWHAGWFCSCGCPSPKVSGRGCFGARHMLNPKFVGEAMSVIAANTNAAVTVKCRIGVDDHDSYNELCKFFLLHIFQVICVLNADWCYSALTHARTFLTFIFSQWRINNFCRVHVLHIWSTSRTFSILFCSSGDFIHIVSSLSPTKHFIIHSRKALLSVLSPSDNRRIPPLKYVQNGFHFLMVFYLEDILL